MDDARDGEMESAPMRRAWWFYDFIIYLAMRWVTFITDRFLLYNGFLRPCCAARFFRSLRHFFRIFDSTI